MNYIDATFYGDDHVPIGTAKVPDTPGGWWVVGTRQDEHQSWERPFFVSLVAHDRKTMDGRLMFVDIGEAFSHFEQRSHKVPDMDAGMSSLFGMFGFSLPAMPTDLPTEFAMPLPHTGRPDRPFPGIGGYLDGCASRMVGTDSGEHPVPLRLVSEGLVFGTEESAREREDKELGRLCLDLAPVSGKGLNFVPNKVMSRTVMREYSVTEEDGTELRVFVGALMQGNDILAYDTGTGVTSLPGDGYAFGRAPLGSAEYYEVSWMATRRFGGACYATDDIGEFRANLVNMYATSRFDAEVLAEMARREKAFRDADGEAHERDMEGLRRLSDEMREDARERDRIREWEDARRRQRKIDSDRRIREGWSAVNRGVEQYRGPDGRLIEVPVAGPGYRAYYDRSSGTVVHTDGYMGDWEELPRWRW